MDALVLVPIDTDCILNGTAGRRWRGEREQPGSKCYSPSVLRCWSWTSTKSISLVQVSENSIPGYLGQALDWGKECGRVKTDCEEGGAWDSLWRPETILRLTWIFLDFAVLDFPRRPPWNYEMSKEQLMSQEERSFQEYLGKIHGAYMSEKLSYFEHNLEVRMERGQEYSIVT